MPRSRLNIRFRVLGFLGTDVVAGVTLSRVMVGNSKHL
jgi:hypothetical protein